MPEKKLDDWGSKSEQLMLYCFVVFIGGAHINGWITSCFNGLIKSCIELGPHTNTRGYNFILDAFFFLVNPIPG